MFYSSHSVCNCILVKDEHNHSFLPVVTDNKAFILSRKVRKQYVKYYIATVKVLAKGIGMVHR